MRAEMRKLIELRGLSNVPGDNLCKKSAKIGRKIAEIQRELSSSGRGSRVWEEQWCRMRGEDEWADKLAERRRQKESKLWSLEHQQMQITRGYKLQPEGQDEVHPDGTECEILEFPFSFQLS